MPRPATSSTGGSSAKSTQPQNRRVATASGVSKVTSNSDGKPSRSEYAKSFAFSPMRLRPKLRNPIPTWGTRNRSDIIPSSVNPTGPLGGRRVVPPIARQWPWQERAARSEIFVNSLRSTDANNNPAPGIINGGAGRRGGLQPQHRWPWQRRAQSSGVFLFGLDNDQTTPSTTSTTFNVPVRKWPWAERAMKSLIFNQPEEKITSRRTYKWDQRRTTTPFFEDSATRPTTPARKKAWPWQEMAKESLIFKPLPPKPPKGILYPWDQRQSDLIFDPNAKFDMVSRYKTEFVTKKSTDGSSIRAAGLRCYKGEIGGPGKVGLQERPQENIILPPEEESNKQSEEKEVENQQTKIKQKQNKVNFPPQTTDSDMSSSSADEKENNVPKPQPKKTFTVLQDVSNRVKNVESKSESNLLDQFANMKIKPEKQKMKQIGQIVMERPPKGKVDDNMEVINVQD